VWVRANTISDLSPLTGLLALNIVEAGYTSVTRLEALVANEGLSAGDEVGVIRSSLICDATTQQDIATLEGRGVAVDHDCQF
jgi:hypothetical protein